MGAGLVEEDDLSACHHALRELLHEVHLLQVKQPWVLHGSIELKAGLPKANLMLLVDE